MHQFSILIDTNSANQRFDRFCRKYFKPYSHITLKDIYHWIRKGLIRIQAKGSNHSKKAEENTTLHEGDQIIFHQIISEQLVDKSLLKNNSGAIQTFLSKQGRSWESLILYEDEDWIAWNKPAGIVAHEGNKHTEDITMNQLLEYKSNLDNQNKEKLEAHKTFKPAFAFRLDKDTTGVLISAKNYPALQYINELIRDHNIRKIYLARVQWETSRDNNHIKLPLFKGFNATSGRAQTFVNQEKGLESTTIVTTLQNIHHEQLGAISLVKCELLSGRMHQIRVHLAHLGHPVIGDIQYGNAVINRLANKYVHITRQLLHSYHYTFTDYKNKEVSVIAPLPQEFYSLWEINF